MAENTKDSFLMTLEGGEGEIVEKKSRFIATVRPVASEEEALAFIEEMKKKYWDARHNCSAFVIGRNQELMRFSDDGEPQGTAGKPMLDVLLGAGLHNTAVVVTRYFGGTLLGTGGLVRAYGGAAALALQKARVVTMQVVVPGVWRVSYAQYEQALRILEEFGARLDDTRFEADVALHFCMLAQGREALCEKAREFCRGEAKLQWQAARCAPF